MNVHDSERMKGMLESLGYTEADERADADLILFNTCSIREAADNRFIAHLGEAKRLKSEDPERVVGVGGCWAQSVKDEVFERFPFVDVAFGPGQIARRGVPHLRLAVGPGVLRVRGLLRPSAHEARARVPGLAADLAGVQLPLLVLHRAVDPRARAEPRPAELVAEVDGLARDGVREVTLLGQNVNSYGRDLGARRTTFAELLALIDGVDGIERIRYTSPHPKDMREDVIRAHAELAAVCETSIPVGIQPGAEGDAPHLQPRAVPRSWR